jgi:hypothetical protein
MSFLEKKVNSSGLIVPPEMYHSVHVMQDDLDALQGKAPTMPVAQPAEVSAPGITHPFLKNDSPFGENGMPEAGAEKTIGSPAPFQAKPFDKRYYLYGGLALLLLAVIGVGLYFFVTGTPRQETPSQPQAVENIPTDTQLTPQDGAAMTYYSLTNPNHLVLDVESDAGTPEGVKKILSGVVTRVLSMRSSDPVEFVVVDKNNAPIAFSRFAYLAGMKLPDEMMSVVGEGFSVYMTEGNGVVRAGVAIDISDEKKMTDAIRKSETNLPKYFQSLLYDAGTTIPESAEFRTGMFGMLETRFAIVDAVKDRSFDYVVLGKQLVIGTSKESFHAMLTRIVQSGTK